MKLSNSPLFRPLTPIDLDLDIEKVERACLTANKLLPLEPLPHFDFISNCSTAKGESADDQSDSDADSAYASGSVPNTPLDEEFDVRFDKLWAALPPAIVEYPEMDLNITWDGNVQHPVSVDIRVASALAVGQRYTILNHTDPSITAWELLSLHAKPIIPEPDDDEESNWDLDLANDIEDGRIPRDIEEVAKEIEGAIDHELYRRHVILRQPIKLSRRPWEHRHSANTYDRGFINTITPSNIDLELSSDTPFRQWVECKVRASIMLQSNTHNHYILRIPGLQPTTRHTGTLTLTITGEENTWQTISYLDLLDRKVPLSSHITTSSLSYRDNFQLVLSAPSTPTQLEPTKNHPELCFSPIQTITSTPAPSPEIEEEKEEPIPEVSEIIVRDCLQLWHSVPSLLRLLLVLWVLLRAFCYPTVATLEHQAVAITASIFTTPQPEAYVTPLVSPEAEEISFVGVDTQGCEEPITFTDRVDYIFGYRGQYGDWSWHC